MSNKQACRILVKITSGLLFNDFCNLRHGWDCGTMDGPYNIRRRLPQEFYFYVRCTWKHSRRQSDVRTPSWVFRLRILRASASRKHRSSSLRHGMVYNTHWLKLIIFPPWSLLSVSLLLLLHLLSPLRYGSTYRLVVDKNWNCGLVGLLKDFSSWSQNVIENKIIRSQIRRSVWQRNAFEILPWARNVVEILLDL